MRRMRTLGSRLLGFFLRDRREQGLDDELQSHLGLLAEENIRRGMSPDEARCAARREFGGVEQTKESYREQRGLPFLDALWQDLRFAVRILAKKPGFTTIAIATLAVGIGANTAIFSVVHSVLLQALPYPDSKRLTVVWSIFGTEGRAPASGPELVYLRERSRLFEEFGGIWAQRGALTGEGEPEHVRLGLVTSNFLSMLATKPELGRFFVPEEQGTYSAKSVILSDALWRHRCGANPRLIGQSVRLNGHPITVVGVMPPDFKIIFPEGSSVPPEMDAFVPFASNLAQDPRDQCYIRVIGRLRKGVAIPQAQAELESIATQLRSEFTEFSEQALGLQAVPLHGDVVRNVRPALIALFGGVSLVLLIACANVANLLLSRANERQKVPPSARRWVPPAPGKSAAFDGERLAFLSRRSRRAAAGFVGHEAALVFAPGGNGKPCCDLFQPAGFRIYPDAIDSGWDLVWPCSRSRNDQAEPRRVAERGRQGDGRWQTTAQERAGRRRSGFGIRVAGWRGTTVANACQPAPRESGIQCGTRYDGSPLRLRSEVSNARIGHPFLSRAAEESRGSQWN